MRRLTDRTVTNLQTLLVLAGYIALLIFAPHEWLRPLSVGVVVFAVLVVVGVRAYLRRLEVVEHFLASDDAASGVALAAALLSEGERRLLRVNLRGTAAEITGVLRRRQAALTSAAMCVAIPGLCAFLLALYFYSD